MWNPSRIEPRREKRDCRSVETHPEATGQILDILPGDPARARAAGDRPFVRLLVELCGRQRQAVARGVAFDHREVGILVAVVKAEPEAEAIGERDLFLDGLVRVNRGRTLV